MAGIAQEALTNISKHAQATKIVATVEERNGSVSMIITDDGIGFAPAHEADGQRNQGWGIITMMERAEAEGGRFRIEPGPEGGTSVIVEVNR